MRKRQTTTTIRVDQKGIASVTEAFVERKIHVVRTKWQQQRWAYSNKTDGRTRVLLWSDTLRLADNLYWQKTDHRDDFQSWDGYKINPRWADHQTMLSRPSDHPISFCKWLLSSSKLPSGQTVNGAEILSTIPSYSHERGRVNNILCDRCGDEAGAVITIELSMRQFTLYISTVGNIFL